MVLVVLGMCAIKPDSYSTNWRFRGVLNMYDNFNKIENKLSQLGITSKYGSNTIKDLEKIEEALSFTLPIEYKEFLYLYGTLNFNDIEIAFSSLDTSNEEPLTIVNFYGLNGNDYDNLKLIINQYTDRIPDDLIPIAECPGGDQICIGINNKAFGKIYFWDHNKEKLHVNTTEEMWEPVTLIYNTFLELIMSSQELKEDEDFDDSIVENIKVSDKFLSRFNK